MRLDAKEIQAILEAQILLMTAPIALITGITGQDGSYLTELLLIKGYVVHGMVRRTSSLSRSRLQQFYDDPGTYNERLFLHYADLDDPTTMRRVLTKVAPDEVYHLAGQSHVGLSFEIPESTCDMTAMATLRLLEMIRDLPKSPRLYHASTSEIFGRPVISPQTEVMLCAPVNPYGAAKAFATQMVKIYREAFGLFACNGITYNHESPRRGENFVTRKISKQVARIKLGLAQRLVLGSVTAARDWGHAEDYVKAMWLILQHPTADDYIVSTGKTHTVLEFVQAAFAVVDLPWENYLVSEAALERRTEPGQLCGDPSKIQKQLGWSPSRTFNDLVREMVEADLAEQSK